MKRKDILKELLSPDLSGDAPTAGVQPSAPRAPSGAVRAMGMALGRLATDGQELDALRKRIEEGDVVVEVDPALVEPSFASDRLARKADPDFATLLDSMRASGQQVPILLRPHPDEPGRYQVAYGHRRLVAAAELGVSVRAVIRRMSDAELVIAQGKENAERRNLSYIERALFAAELDARGFARQVIQSALSAHAAEMTRYLALAKAVPRDVVEAIGPAPRAGRPRWLELSKLLDAPGARSAAKKVIARQGFAALGSDGRFEALIVALRPTPVPSEVEEVVIRNARDIPIMRARPNPDGFQIMVLPGAPAGFRDRLLARLSDLAMEYDGSGEDDRPRG